MGGNDTTIGLSYETRDMLKDLKIIPNETYDNVIQRVVDIALKVPDLEKEIGELRAKAWEEHLDYERLKEDYQKLKVRTCMELEGDEK